MFYVDFVLYSLSYVFTLHNTIVFYWIYARCTWSEMTKIKLFNQHTTWHEATSYSVPCYVMLCYAVLYYNMINFVWLRLLNNDFSNKAHISPPGWEMTQPENSCPTPTSALPSFSSYWVLVPTYWMCGTVCNMYMKFDRIIFFWY